MPPRGWDAATEVNVATEVDVSPERDASPERDSSPDTDRVTVVVSPPPFEMYEVCAARDRRRPGRQFCSPDAWRPLPAANLTLPSPEQLQRAAICPDGSETAGQADRSPGRDPHVRRHVTVHQGLRPCIRERFSLPRMAASPSRTRLPLDFPHLPAWRPLRHNSYYSGQRQPLGQHRYRGDRPPASSLLSLSRTAQLENHRRGAPIGSRPWMRWDGGSHLRRHMTSSLYLLPAVSGGQPESCAAVRAHGRREDDGPGRWKDRDGAAGSGD